MTITELIAALAAVRAQHGDLVVVQREACYRGVTLFEPANAPGCAYLLPAEDLEPSLRYATSNDDSEIGEYMLVIGKTHD